jgi:hypothetical protein
VELGGKVFQSLGAWAEARLAARVAVRREARRKLIGGKIGEGRTAAEYTLRVNPLNS